MKIFGAIYRTCSRLGCPLWVIQSSSHSNCLRVFAARELEYDRDADVNSGNVVDTMHVCFTRRSVGSSENVPAASITSLFHSVLLLLCAVKVECAPETSDVKQDFTAYSPEASLFPSLF